PRRCAPSVGAEPRCVAAPLPTTATDLAPARGRSRRTHAARRPRRRVACTGRYLGGVDQRRLGYGGEVDYSGAVGRTQIACPPSGGQTRTGPAPDAPTPECGHDYPARPTRPH